MEERRKRRRTPDEREDLQDKGCLEKKAKIQDGEVFPTDKPHEEEKTSFDANMKKSPCVGVKPPEGETKKRKRTEEEQPENKKESLSDETRKPESKKRKPEEDETPETVKKSSTEDNKILQSSSDGRREEQETTVEKKRPRSPEDLLEGESAQKKSRVDVTRPAPLGIQSYKFHRQLGEGSGGKVMLASFTPTKQLVAIKMVPKKPSRSNYECIRMEARLLKIARGCPFLCHSHATFQSEVRAFFVLEYAGGGTLHRIITNQGNLSMKTIKFYTAEMVIALQFLHSNGIIHRDLKPENILVDNDGHIKICDFGLAAEEMFAGKEISGLGGTPGYRAPEILSLEKYDAGVDWWSFGVIMYEMATGRQPFIPSLVPAREFFEIKRTKLDFPSHMSQEMLDLLPKLLEMDKNKRLGVNGNIRGHPFYGGVNWSELESRTMPTPFKPKIPPVDKLKVIQPRFSAETSKLDKVEDLSDVDSNWNWQE
uniref:Protein kinase domain-containing protein n=1 Tax=Xenopus tropicalis TaxID=8364 RepID=A0A803JX33_XENTR